jgi:hypothetical protein
MYGTEAAGACLAAKAAWAEPGIDPANVSIPANIKKAQIAALLSNHDFFIPSPYQKTAIAIEKQCSQYNVPRREQKSDHRITLEHRELHIFHG